MVGWTLGVHSAPAQAAENSQAAQPDVEAIISHVEAVQAANPSRSRAYILTREYKFFQGKEGNDPKAQVTAEITFLPPSTKTFRIVNAEGSGRGEAVVKHMLENEAEMAKDVRNIEVSRNNYSFRLDSVQQMDGRRCYVLAMSPKRRDHGLLDGKAWVDAETYRVMQVEGTPAKSPSWWLHKTYVTMSFGELNGLWLPVRTQGIAEVRLFGTYVLASRAVRQEQPQEVVAMNRKPSRSHARPQRTLGTVIEP
jgi:hypothetical protein